MVEGAGSRTKVLVVEDHAALGEALLFAFSFESDIEVVGLAPTVAAALSSVAESRPDVVLMDVRLPDGNGIDATRQVLELHPSAAGAAGFVPKDVRIAKIVAAVRAVRAGEVAVDPTVLHSLLAQAAADGEGAGDGRPVAGAGLATDQLAILELLAQGAGLPGIGDKLGLDDVAVGAAVTTTLAQLGARSPLEALVLAARQSLLSPGPG